MQNTIGQQLGVDIVVSLPFNAVLAQTSATDFVNELLGHSSGNIDMDRDGKGYNPDILYNKCVKKINYETSHTRGIDFMSLKIDWKKIITTRVWWYLE